MGAGMEDEGPEYQILLMSDASCNDEGKLLRKGMEVK